MRIRRKMFDCATLLTVMMLCAWLEAISGWETTAWAQGMCEDGGYGIMDGGTGATKREAVRSLQEEAAETCSSVCAARGPCSENKPACKGAVRVNNRMHCQMNCFIGC